MLRDSTPQTQWLYESIMEHMQLVLKNYSLCYIIQLCWIHNWFALKEHRAVPQGALNKELLLRHIPFKNTGLGLDNQVGWLVRFQATGPPGLDCSPQLSPAEDQPMVKKNCILA